MNKKLAVVYWDSSALLSYLFRDEHSDVIIDKARQKGVHLLTTLTVAEIFTIISRVRREHLLSEMLVDSLFELLESGPWSKLNIVPDTLTLKELAYKWPLGGTSLWHLATAKTLQQEFPELMILTLDRQLARASRGESIRLCLNAAALDPDSRKRQSG